MSTYIILEYEIRKNFLKYLWISLGVEDVIIVKEFVNIKEEDVLLEEYIFDIEKIKRDFK